MHFWPFQTFVGHIECPNSPNIPQNGLKACAPFGPIAQPEKGVFGPLFTLFWSQNDSTLDFMGHTGGQSGPNRPQSGLKTNLQAPQVVTCRKNDFDPFLTHFGLFFGGPTKIPQNVANGHSASKNRVQWCVWAIMRGGNHRKWGLGRGPSGFCP